jgi:hypothetical protein
VRKLTFDSAVRDAEALLRLGQADVYLDSDDSNLPWDLVESVEPGGTHRNGIQVNIQVTAKHASGRRFSKAKLRQ